MKYLQGFRCFSLGRVITNGIRNSHPPSPGNNSKIFTLKPHPNKIKDNSRVFISFIRSRGLDSLVKRGLDSLVKRGLDSLVKRGLDSLVKRGLDH
jgi:hypothetical protein